MVIQVVEVIKLKTEFTKQLNQAKQQLLIWNTKIKELTGSLAACDIILKKSEEKK